MEGTKHKKERNPYTLTQWWSSARYVIKVDLKIDVQNGHKLDGSTFGQTGGASVVLQRQKPCSLTSEMVLTSYMCVCAQEGFVKRTSSNVCHGQ